MNGDSRGSERTPFEVILFIIGFVGFYFSVAGAIVSSIPALVTGGFLLAIAVAYFVLRDQ